MTESRIAMIGSVVLVAAAGVAGSLTQQLPRVDTRRIYQTFFVSGIGDTSHKFSAADARDREVVAKVIAWVNSANVIGPEKPSITGLPGKLRPDAWGQFGVDYDAGTHIWVSPYTQCLPNPDGKTSTCTLVRNEVVFISTLYKGGDPVILESPELFSWITGGWENDLE